MADSLSDLRAAAKRGNRAVGQKLSKMRRRDQNPVELSGTRYDVSVSASRIDSMSRRQLQTLIQRQNNFRLRSTNFVQLANGQVITGSRFSETRKLHRQYNSIAVRRQQQVENLKPRGGLSIKEAEAAFTPRFRTIGGYNNNALLSPRKLNANEIADMKALSRIERDFRKKLASGYHPKAIKRQRNKSARQMIKETGDSELLKEFDSLTDDQFDLLWNFRSGFAEAVQLRYGIESEANGARWYDDIIEDHTRDARELIAWAKTVPMGNLPQSPKAKRSRR